MCYIGMRRPSVFWDLIMLKKDILELCLLHLLAGQDHYGYELLRPIHNQFPDLQESTIYAALRNLCREDYLETYTGNISEGPVRKYYRIVEKGRIKLAALLEEWRALQIAMSNLGVGELQKDRNN